MDLANPAASSENAVAVYVAGAGARPKLAVALRHGHGGVAAVDVGNGALDRARGRRVDRETAKARREESRGAGRRAGGGGIDAGPFAPRPQPPSVSLGNALSILP